MSRAFPGTLRKVKDLFQDNELLMKAFCTIFFARDKRLLAVSFHIGSVMGYLVLKRKETGKFVDNAGETVRVAYRRDRAPFKPMMTPSRMEFISCLVLREKAQEVAAQIESMGLVHPVDLRDIEEPLKSLSSFDVAGDSTGLDTVEAQLRDPRFQAAKRGT
jgi:hypothetical protein